MSFFDDASLVFLPSGQAGKDGKAYSMKPTNGDGDFTFSRGSNLTATRIDSNGLIAKGRENLFKQSNNFNTTPWASSVTLTSGQSGYDGSNDAWLLTKTSSGAKSVYNYINETGVMTMSVYAKAGSVNWMRLTQGGKTAYFDLSGSGAVGTSSNGIDQTITSVGNGWFRCTLTANKTTAGQTPIYPYTAEGDASGSTDSIYIQDSQFEQGLVATEYIESGATTGLAGILEDSPRFDYSGGASCPSLLLEPSRTNLIEQSEYITDGTAITAVNNDTQSPEGLVNATRFRLGVDESATRHRKIFSQSVASGEDYSFSVFFKEADAQWIQLLGNTIGSVFDSQVYVNFDLQNGVKGNVGTSVIDSGIEDYGNGWYRCYMVATAQATATGFFEILTTNNTDSGRYPSYENTTAINYCYVYGAQVEEGSYPTSYIPNQSGGSVTREAEDIAINTLDQTYSTDITLFFEVERLVSTSDINKEIAVVINSTTSPNNRFTFYSTSNGRFRILITDDSGNTDNLYSATNAFEKGETIKVALKITSSGCTLFVDGSSVDTSSGIGRILGIDRISFFRDSIIKQYLMFPTALSDVEMITLTS